MTRAREGLKERGLIDFKKGAQNSRAPCYEIITDETACVTACGTANGTACETIIYKTEETKTERISSNAREQKVLKDMNELQNILMADADWKRDILLLMTNEKRAIPDGQSLDEFLRQFFLYLCTSGTTHKDERDCRNHFINWLKKQIINNKTTNSKYETQIDNKIPSVEALKSMLAQQRTMRPRFKFPIVEEELIRYLQAAIMEEVEYRHRTFEPSDSLNERIRKMAQWLANDNTKNGMMLCGTCGNGKTTFIKAAQKLFNLFRLPDNYNNSTFGIKLITAKDIVYLYKSNFKSWKDLAKSPMIVIDDLGCEPTELLDFGNVSNPVIDLLSIRYDEQLTTLISTNLTPAEIRAKYGDRIADRLNEMVERIHFDNATFRTDAYK